MNITPATKVAVPLAMFGTLAAGLVWIGTVITDASWKVKSLEQRQGAVEAKMEQLPTKADFLQVRLELGELREASEQERKAARRRPGR